MILFESDDWKDAHKGINTLTEEQMEFERLAVETMDWVIDHWDTYREMFSDDPQATWEECGNEIRKYAEEEAGKR